MFDGLQSCDPRCHAPRSNRLLSAGKLPPDERPKQPVWSRPQPTYPPINDHVVVLLPASWVDDHDPRRAAAPVNAARRGLVPQTQPCPRRL